MTTQNKTLTKLNKAIAIKETLMQDNVHYGKISGATSDFLWLSGASLLADEFEIDALLEDLREETIDGECRITVVLNMVQSDSGDRICAGVGTWDSGEMLGDRQGARQRGIAMAYKRAYVLGVRYATATHGLFSQDDDLVKKQTANYVPKTSPVITENTYVEETPVETQDVALSDFVLPPEMALNDKGEPLFTRFGTFVIGRTIKEVLADTTPDDKSGEPKGIGYLKWIRDKTDASELLKLLLNEGLGNNANN